MTEKLYPFLCYLNCNPKDINVKDFKIISSVYNKKEGNYLCTIRATDSAIKEVEKLPNNPIIKLVY